MTSIFFVQCIIKHQNNQGLGKGYQLQSFALADNPCLDVGYLPSSNSCLIMYQIC